MYTVQHKLASSLVCNLGWPQTHDATASVSKILQLQMCTTAPGYKHYCVILQLPMWHAEAYANIIVFLTVVTNSLRTLIISYLWIFFYPLHKFKVFLAFFWGFPYGNSYILFCFSFSFLHLQVCGVSRHVCMHVQIRVNAPMCAGGHAHVCSCLWNPVLDSQSLPPLLCTISTEAGLLS